MSLPLPGEREAGELGYSLLNHSGNHQRATYVKDGIFFNIHYGGGGLAGNLSFFYGLLVISTFGSDFSFPNKNFAAFEKQIRRVYDLCHRGAKR